MHYRVVSVQLERRSYDLSKIFLIFGVSQPQDLMVSREADNRD